MRANVPKSNNINTTSTILTHSQHVSFWMEYLLHPGLRPIACFQAAKAPMGLTRNCLCRFLPEFSPSVSFVPT